MVAAQNTDLQRVWRLVQELSAQLKSNQQETERLRRYVELNPSHSAQARNGNKESNNGSETGCLDPPDSEVVHDLRHAYALLADENATLRSENEELSQLCAEFEIGLTRAMNQIRTHEFEVTMSTLKLHENYASQIQTHVQEKSNMAKEATEIHGQMQSLSNLLRSALQAQSDVEAETIIETLRLENDDLRRRLEENSPNIEGNLDSRTTL